jgi:putative membrane protein
MLKHLGRLAALAGLVAALVLIAREHPGEILGLLRVAGFGLVAAGLIHILPMFVSAFDWRTLVFDPRRPGVLAMFHMVWMRESVNGLLPVARIGGEVVSFSLLRQRDVGAPAAGASIIVDMQLAVISQLLFTMVGIGLLFARADSGTLRLAIDLAWGAAVLAPMLLLFALVQHVNPFERLARAFNRMTSGKFAALVGTSAQVDASIKVVWRQRGVVLRYLFFWQPLKYLTTSLEIWAALYFLRVPVGLSEAIVFESLIQAISSAAFFVPAGLGVQEGGFVVIGGAFGLDPATSIALAGARRVRDLVIYLPGLCAWQFVRWSRPAASVAAATESVPVATGLRSASPRCEADADR